MKKDIGKKKRFWLFSIIFILTFLCWRIYVYLFYLGGNFSWMRGLTGLTIHHYHCGILMILTASPIFMFHRVNLASVVLMSFGMGTIFDSFVSSLIKSTNRSQEIFNYQHNFFVTLGLFVLVEVFAWLILIWSERAK